MGTEGQFRLLLSVSQNYSRLLNRTTVGFVIKTGMKPARSQVAGGAPAWKDVPAWPQGRRLLVLVPALDQVLDVQDGGGQVLLQAFLWRYRQE